MVVVVGICRRITRKVSGMLFCNNSLPGKDKCLEMNSIDGELEEFGLLVLTSGGERWKLPLLVTDNVYLNIALSERNKYDCEVG